MAKSLFDVATPPSTKAAKIPAVKKVPAAKEVKKVAAPVKAVKAAAAKPAVVKAAPAQVQIVRAFAILGSNKDRYSELTGNRKAFSAYTIAALVTANMIKVTEKGAAMASKGNVSMFRALVGNTAAVHWNAQGRIGNDGQITAAGINEVQSRLAGQSRGYNTEAEFVTAFVGAMAKGGSVELNGGKFKLSSEVAAKV